VLDTFYRRQIIKTTFFFFVVLFLLPDGSLKAQNITNGLAGYYTFCDCTGKDYSGNQRHATISGSPQCIRGILDYGFLLNQIPVINQCGQPGGQYIALPAIDPIWSAGFSVAAWVRFDELKNFERIIDLSNGNGEAGGLPIWFGREGNSNNLTLESWINTDGVQARAIGRLVAVDAISNGSIEYYCATISGDTMRIYVNAVLKAERVGNPIANVRRINNNIGRSAWCMADPDFKGFIDEVRIYNRPLSSSEIAALYKITNVTNFEVKYSCTSAEVDFTINNSPKTDSIVWDFGDIASGSSNTANGLSVSHKFSDTDLYNVRVIGYKSCLNDTVRKQVRIENYKNFLGPDITLCKGSSIVSVNYEGATYKWQDGSTDNSLAVTEPGNYILNLTQHGCVYSDSILVKSNKTFTAIQKIACNGEGFDGYTSSGDYKDTFTGINGCDSIRSLRLTVLPAASSIINASICEGQSFLGYSKAGTYTDIFVSTNGCDSTRIINLQTKTFPRFNLGNDTTICIGDTLVLSPGIYPSYRWNNGSTANYFPVTKAGRYAVEVTNECGTLSDEIVVWEEKCEAYFPNAFTPNKDGRNDQFKILRAHAIESYSLIVYNRWGQKVFQTDDYKKGWDGSMNNYPLDTNTFAWFCHYKIKGQAARFEKGTVLLIR
jgi:gliding motility-associated-like protein